jgi:hypothetical protein
MGTKNQGCVNRECSLVQAGNAHVRLTCFHYSIILSSRPLIPREELREAQECACSLIEELLEEPYLSSGTRGERPAFSSGTAGGGKPADNVLDGPSRKGPSGYPCDLC